MRNQVTRLTGDYIDNRAERLILNFEPSVLTEPKPTPIFELTSWLQKRYPIKVDFNNDLGFSIGKKKILGRSFFTPKSYSIFIDSTLVNSPRLKFALAHEYGHLSIHYNLKLLQNEYETESLLDDEIDHKTGKKKLITDRDWIEWQANRYAASLLLPKSTFSQGLVKVQNELGIRSPGKIYLGAQSYYKKDYLLTIKGLSDLFDVPKISIKYRLNDLKLILNRTNDNWQNIGDCL